MQVAFVYLTNQYADIEAESGRSELYYYEAKIDRLPSR